MWLGTFRLRVLTGKFSPISWKTDHAKKVYTVFKIICFFILQGEGFRWESVEKLIKNHIVPLFLISLTMQLFALFKGLIWLVRGTTHPWLLTRA